MEHRDLDDPGTLDLGVPLGDRAQVQAAERAAGEAAKLEMHQPLRMRHGHRLAGDRLKLAPRDHIADIDARRD